MTVDRNSAIANVATAPTSATTSTKQLEVVSWWTSSSEAKALGVLFAAFRDSNPGVHAINGAIRGGAGSNAIVAAYHLIRALEKLEAEWNVSIEAAITSTLRGE